MRNVIRVKGFMIPYLLDYGNFRCDLLYTYLIEIIILGTYLNYKT